jgi:hypothetical protein
MGEENKIGQKQTTDLETPPVREKPVTEKEVRVVEERPVKQKSGCGKGCLIVGLILLFLLLLVGGGAYLGYRRITKAMEPVDLEIEYTEQDYLEIMDEIGLEADPSQLCIDCPTPTFSDPHEVDVSVSNSQASAAFEYVNQHLSNASISGTQIKMGDGQAELSTTLTFQGRTFPIYMVGSVSKATDNSIDGEISTIKAGALKVPDTMVSYVKDFLVDTANEKLASAGDTVRIDDIDIKPEGLNFKGLVPTKAQ